MIKYEELKGMTLKVEKRKSKGGSEYCCLVVDFGYRAAVVSFDTAFISEISNITVSQLNMLKLGDSIEIGKICTVDSCK